MASCTTDLQVTPSGNSFVKLAAKPNSLSLVLLEADRCNAWHISASWRVIAARCAYFSPLSRTPATCSGRASFTMSSPKASMKVASVVVYSFLAWSMASKAFSSGPPSSPKTLAKLFA